MIRDCPEFKPHNHSGASNRQDRILQKQYGISLEEYDSMLLRQDHKCRICEIPDDQFVGSFHVDHSHTSGKVRGLLCPSYNHAVGMLDDNITKLRRTRKYMSTYGDVKLTPLERRSQLFIFASNKVMVVRNIHFCVELLRFKRSVFSNYVYKLIRHNS